LNTELESGPDSFVVLVTVVAFPITMFAVDSIMLVSCCQGEQIGRTFAYWAIVFFGQLLKITEVTQIV
jgi:hypothetical protein